MSTASEKARDRTRLYGLLGELPSRDAMVVRQVSVDTHQSYQLEKLLIDCNGREAVPAIFLSPPVAHGKRLPVILYNHASGDDFVLGKMELLRGRAALQDPPYGEVLVA